MEGGEPSRSVMTTLAYCTVCRFYLVYNTLRVLVERACCGRVGAVVRSGRVDARGPHGKVGTAVAFTVLTASGSMLLPGLNLLRDPCREDASATVVLLVP